MNECDRNFIFVQQESKWVCLGRTRMSKCAIQVLPKFKRCQSKFGEVIIKGEPSTKAIQEWTFDITRPETPDGCHVEADGCCKHGWDSWMLYMGVI